METKKFRTKPLIPLITAAVSVLFIILGVTEYGFWSNQPMPGFFPVIIAVLLLISSIACFFQLLRNKEDGVAYHRSELMVILGAGGIIQIGRAACRERGLRLV